MNDRNVFLTTWSRGSLRKGQERWGLMGAYFLVHSTFLLCSHGAEEGKGLLLQGH